MCKDTLLYLVFHSEIDYVSDAIKSISDELARTPFDVIVIDTSSDEKAGVFLRQALPKNWKIVKHQSILIQVVQFVIANYAPNYKYIVRLDSDDELLPYSIENLKIELDSDPKLGAVYGGWKLIDNRGMYISDVEAPSPNSLQGFHGACTLIRTSAIRDLDFSSMDINAQDGYAVYMHLKFKGVGIKRLAGPVFKYRRHAINLSSNFGRLWRSRLNILRHYCSEITANSCVLIDSDVSELGGKDQEFLERYLEVSEIHNGTHRLGNRAISIDTNGSLLEYLRDQYRPSKEVVLIINMKKLGRSYFDGLAEYLCLVAAYQKVWRVFYGKVVEEPIWSDNEKGWQLMNCDQASDHGWLGRSVYRQVMGLSVIDFSLEPHHGAFVATDNFFTSAVEGYHLI